MPFQLYRWRHQDLQYFPIVGSWDASCCCSVCPHPISLPIQVNAMRLVQSIHLLHLCPRLYLSLYLCFRHKPVLVCYLSGLGMLFEWCQVISSGSEQNDLTRTNPYLCNTQTHGQRLFLVFRFPAGGRRRRLQLCSSSIVFQFIQ